MWSEAGPWTTGVLGGWEAASDGPELPRPKNPNNPNALADPTDLPARLPAADREGIKAMKMTDSKRE